MSGGLLPIHGLVAADVPATVTLAASKPVCCPEAPSVAGFGYLGGGFGPYRRCQGCGEPFGKIEARG